MAEHDRSQGGYVEAQDIDGFERFGQTLCDWHFHWSLHRRGSSPYQGVLRGRRYPDAIFTDARFEAIEGARTASEIRPADDAFVGIALLLEGGESVRQGRRHITARPGQVFLFDLSEPAEFETHGVTRCLTLFLRHEVLQQHFTSLNALLGQSLDPESAMCAVLASHLETLHRQIDRAAERERKLLLRSTMALLANCFFSGRGQGVERPHLQSMMQRIEDCIDAHLLDLDLTPDFVASEMGLSTRYLRRILSDCGTNFTELVRNGRLSRAALALMSPAGATGSLTQIAHRFGFCDSSHFSHAFRARYGCTPKQYRSISII